MINSKLSKKSLKKRSLKLKNKRTKKTKVFRKNVRNMKGGVKITIEEASKMLSDLRKKNIWEILEITDKVDKVNLHIQYKKLVLKYHPDKYNIEVREIIEECFKIVGNAHSQAEEYIEKEQQCSKPVSSASSKKASPKREQLTLEEMKKEAEKEFELIRDQINKIKLTKLKKETYDYEILMEIIQPYITKQLNSLLDKYGYLMCRNLLILRELINTKLILYLDTLENEMEQNSLANENAGYNEAKHQSKSAASSANRGSAAGWSSIFKGWL